MPRRAILPLLLLAFLWGGSFLFVGVAVREWPPLPIVLARVGWRRWRCGRWWR
jgi:hypothetical protein